LWSSRFLSVWKKRRINLFVSNYAYEWRGLREHKTQCGV
jgi:hypothetical protein